MLAREFPTESGPIDALGIDQSGQVYLIETKLYRNNDKRLVVAQVLDYGASLWRHSIDFNEFISTLDAKSQRVFEMSLVNKLQEFFAFDIAGTEQLLANVKNNLNTGNFKFVVLMDKLHDRLRDLIVFMNSNSNFDIYAVELEYYRHKEFEIIIPKLYGAEVKKEVKPPKKGLIFTNDEILRGYTEVGLSKQIGEFLAIFNGVKNGQIRIQGISISTEATKYLTFNQPNDGLTSASLHVLPTHIPQIEVWTIKKKELSVAKALSVLGIEPKPMKKGNGKVGEILLQSFDGSAFVTFLKALGQA